MSDPKQRGFKRLHFFKMFLTDQDWNQRHSYHTDKQRLHNIAMHHDGIVESYKSGLMVRQRQRPELSIIVDPGYAIDTLGRDVVLEESKVLRISRDEFYFPCTVYVVARYAEDVVEQQRMKDGSRMPRYFGETCEVDVVARELKEHEVMLAKIRITEDAYKITDARDPFEPDFNEIDLSLRRSSFGLNLLPPQLTRQLLNAIHKRRYLFIRFGGNRLLRAAAPLAHVLGALSLALEVDILTPSGALAICDALNLLDDALASLIGDRIDDPWVKERPEYQAFKRNIDLIKSLLDGPHNYRLGNLEQVIALLNKLLDDLPALLDLYGNESLIYYEGMGNILEKEYPLSDDWERVKVWSAQFPEKLYVDGLEWSLIGNLNITNEESEKRYKFRVENVIDSWRNRQRLYYPDGTQVDDTGIAHEGGFAYYELHNVVPDTHLAVIRMMDYVRADYELEFIVNEQLVGVSQCIGSDRKARWRNWPFVIPAWYVNDDVIRIKQLMTTAERDVNMYRYWFYQVLDF